MKFLNSPHVYLALTTFIWGGNAVAGKFAVGHVSPMMLTFCRWGIALALIAFIARNHVRRDWPVIRQNWIYLMLMGGVGYTAFNFFLYSGLQYITAINVALEQAAMPVVIFIGSFLLYRTRVTGFQILGYILTLFGVLVVVTAGDPLSLFASSGPDLNRGDLLMLFAALCYGGYSTALRSKPQMHWQSFLTCLVAGALVFATLGIAFEASFGNLIIPTTFQGLLVVVYAGIFPSLVSQGLFIRGVEALGANAAGLYINLVPIFGAILAVALLGESLFYFHVVAFVLVAGGILIAQNRTAPKS